jgi:hypothetical protein
LIWETLVHTFSPSLSRHQVQKLWHAGYHFDYPLPGNDKKKKNNYNIISQDVYPSPTLDDTTYR